MNIQPKSLTSFVVDSWEIMTSSISSINQDVKLFGYDFRGHTRGTLVVGIAYGCPYYNGSAIFFFTCFFFLSTTSEISFIPYKASAAVQALKVCPVQPRVFSSWGITLLEKLRATDES